MLNDKIVQKKNLKLQYSFLIPMYQVAQNIYISN